MLDFDVFLGSLDESEKAREIVVLLRCSRLIGFADKERTRRIECGVSFEAPPSWSYGSYCSLVCSQLDLDAVLPSAAGPDTQSSDDAGMNAFRRGQLQLDAGDPQEHQFVD